MPGENMSSRTYGILLVSIATVMWSSAGLFVRMLDLDVWTVLGWRSFFGGSTLVLIALYSNRRRNPTAKKAAMPLYLLSGLIAAISMFGYIGALKLTTVANVLAIYATLPFVSAGIAYLWMRERVERRVLIASAIAFVGVLIVAGFAARLQDLAGSGLALVMTVTFSVLLVMSRRYSALKLAPVNAIGSGLCVLLCLPLMSHTIPSASELAILALFGSTTSGLAYLLFMTGGRHIPAGEAGLIGLLDIVLGPLWVWMAFGENPGVAALVGGGLILSAVAGYMWSGLRAAQARNAARIKAGRPA
jgi:drug/metabolite transporter (DMT)-like permease